MEENDNIIILDEIHKGAKMGMDAISYVREKSNDLNFVRELSSQYNQYDDILTRVNDSYTNLGIVPKDYNLKQKAMSWMGIQMNTINDTSNSKLSEILIQGTTMGIIEGKKLLNHNPNVDQNISKTLKDFVKMQEDTVEKLKTYL